MGGYRQWSLPSQFNFQNSKHLKSQESRLNLILDKWNKALTENKDTITRMDTNIDASGNLGHNTQFKIQKLRIKKQRPNNFKLL